jgi:hypothetical protein
LQIIEAAEIWFVSGHDFSRAVSVAKSFAALAAGEEATLLKGTGFSPYESATKSRRL